MKLDVKNQYWMGEIPDSWETKKIKFVLSQRNENNVPIKSTEILSLTAKQGVIPYSEKEGGGNKPKQDFSAYKLTYPDDIVMNSMNILSGAVGLSKYMGCISPVYYALKPKNKTDDVRFFYYVFANKTFQNSLLGLGNGILIKQSDNGNFNTIRMRIPIEKLNSLSVPYPSPSIQQQIANYLDNKTTEIDGLIDKINAEIDTLQQYQRSLITRAVTKGLDPNVPMKDSGIKYINQTPENWEITRLKYILSERNSRSSNGKELLLSVSQKRGVLPASEVKRSIKADTLINYKKVYVNDLIFNKLNPALARFAVSDYDGITSPDFSIYYSRKADIQFLCYLLKTEKYITEYKKLCSGVGEGYMRLYTPTLYNIKVSLPPKTEQQQIADYLDNKVSKIQNIIKSKQQQITELTEYKNSLIFEYVTGKKQVKEAN